MCGICGKLHNSPGKIDGELIWKMVQAMGYRGPDDEGIFLSSDLKLGLGHKRLSIIDLSEAGRQPIPNEDKTVWMVFNGEVYNFQSLREELQEKGHVFASKTDSEVIVHLYEEEGIRCLERLNGMFAFGLWDDRTNRLFLCRDRIGGPGKALPGPAFRFARKRRRARLRYLSGRRDRTVRPAG